MTPDDVTENQMKYQAKQREWPRLMLWPTLCALGLAMTITLAGCDSAVDEPETDAAEAEPENGEALAPEEDVTVDEPEAVEDDEAAAEDEAADEVADADKPAYRVECQTDDEGRRTSCAVDQDTFVGWRTVGSNCAVCHGQEAAGSSFAPNLIRRIGEISQERFFEVLENGITTGDSAMPGFGENPNVWPRRDAIYAYLMARHNGDLIPGRPERLQD